MPRTLLCAFLLLFPRGLPSAGAEGALCGRRAPEKGSPAAAFPCPRSGDGADAASCCGSCRLPRGARLDPRRCARASPASLGTTSAPRTSQPPAPKPDREWEVVLIIVVVVSVGGFAFFALCYCKERGWHRRRPAGFTSDQTWVAIHSAARRRHPPPRIPGPPPSYEECGALPPIPEESEESAPPSPDVTLQRVSVRNREDVCFFEPAVHQNMPGPAWETASGADQ